LISKIAVKLEIIVLFSYILLNDTKEAKVFHARLKNEENLE